jgi:hypothetical protein
MNPRIDELKCFTATDACPLSYQVHYHIVCHPQIHRLFCGPRQKSVGLELSLITSKHQMQGFRNPEERGVHPSTPQ